MPPPGRVVLSRETEGLNGGGARRYLKVCRTRLEDLFRECDADLDGRLSPKEAFQVRPR